jgi:transcriptional regulator with XRE-family HTH domain
MKIHGYETNEVILKEIGKRMKSKRIAMNLTQKELAHESGVSQRTISGFENGENISLENVIAILRVLKQIQEINLLFPEEKTNPFDVIQLGNKRQRVSTKKTSKKNTWNWNEES